MFKWLRGFLNGILLTIYIITIALVAFLVWVVKDMKTEEMLRHEKMKMTNHYYKKYYEKERGED